MTPQRNRIETIQHPKPHPGLNNLGAGRLPGETGLTSNDKAKLYQYGIHYDWHIRKQHPEIATEPGWYCECGAPIDCAQDRCGRCGSDKPGRWVDAANA